MWACRVSAVPVLSSTTPTRHGRSCATATVASIRPGTSLRRSTPMRRVGFSLAKAISRARSSVFGVSPSRSAGSVWRMRAGVAAWPVRRSRPGRGAARPPRSAPCPKRSAAPAGRPAPRRSRRAGRPAEAPPPPPAGRRSPAALPRRSARAASICTGSSRVLPSTLKRCTWNVGAAAAWAGRAAGARSASSAATVAPSTSRRQPAPKPGARRRGGKSALHRPTVRLGRASQTGRVDLAARPAGAKALVLGRRLAVASDAAVAGGAAIEQARVARRQRGIDRRRRRRRRDWRQQHGQRAVDVADRVVLRLLPRSARSSRTGRRGGVGGGREAQRSAQHGRRLAGDEAGVRRGQRRVRLAGVAALVVGCDRERRRHDGSGSGVRHDRVVAAVVAVVDRVAAVDDEAAAAGVAAVEGLAQAGDAVARAPGPTRRPALRPKRGSPSSS